MIKTHQVDADTFRVGLSDGSVELREVLLDAEALDEVLVRSFFFFLPLKKREEKQPTLCPRSRKQKKTRIENLSVLPDLAGHGGLRGLPEGARASDRAGRSCRQERHGGEQQQQQQQLRQLLFSCSSR